MKIAIKTNVANGHNGTNELLFDTNALNANPLTLPPKNHVYKFVKTKLIFITLHLIDLLYIIYK